MWDKKPRWRVLDEKIGLIVDEDLHNGEKIDLLFDFCKKTFLVLGASEEHINLMVGEKEYLIKILEVNNGEHWSEK
jgi:hypothetical protein